MKKLLHERLRYIANENEEDIYSNYIIEALCKEFDVCENKSSYAVDIRNCLKAIAAEIEKYYTSLPRDPEGNPVHEGMEVEGGVISHWSVSEDGSWAVFDSNYEEIQCGNKDEPIRLPEPKVLDVDGAPCKKGETVWRLVDSTKWEIIDIHPTEPRITVRQLDIGKDVSGGWFLASGFTHREPDSLEKLRDDVLDTCEPITSVIKQEWADRLTAIMERDA